MEPPRYRVPLDDLSDIQSARPDQVLAIMWRFWTWLARWCAQHGLPIQHAETVFWRGVGCPVHKLPWVWDEQENALVCPKRFDPVIACGIYIADRSEVDPKVMAVLREELREQKQTMRSKHKRKPVEKKRKAGHSR
jgi:hypothetical protein